MADSERFAESFARHYTGAVEAGDLESLMALFEPEAIITSPIKGAVSARDFYRFVFEVVQDRHYQLRHLLVGVGAPPTVAIHAAYSRTVSGGQPATIDVIDLFEFSAPGGLVMRGTIIYDASPVRGDFQQ